MTGFRRFLRLQPALAVVGLPLLAGGCAPGAGLAILQQSAGSVAASGVERTFDGASVKTFTASEAALDAALRRALAAMGFEVRVVRETGSGRVFEAGSPVRRIEAVLLPVAPRATRLRVEVDEGYPFSSDPATATEILIQVADALAAEKQPPS